MSKKVHKTGYIIAGVLVVILLIPIVGFFMFTGSNTRVAFLHVESGEVLVDSGSGWKGAVDGMRLSLDDVVKTGEDGEASLVIYESAIISLDANTEVSIADLSKDKVLVNQDSGSTWNKFTGLSGLKGLEVETPTTVATVRGTGFGVSMEEVSVGHGGVDVSHKGSKKKIRLGPGQRALIRNGTLVMEDLTPEQRKVVLRKMHHQLNKLEKLRHEEIEKHPVALKLIKSRYRLSDQDVKDRMEKIDLGLIDEDELVKKSPFRIKSVEKVVQLTKQIKKQRKLISELEQKGLNE